MQPTKLVLLKFVGIAMIAAVAAVLTIFSWAFTTGEDPSDDGPRALLAQFFGYWIGFDLLIYSFTDLGGNSRWLLRALSFAAVLIGIGFAVYFSVTPEVSEPHTTEGIDDSGTI